MDTEQEVEIGKFESQNGPDLDSVFLCDKMKDILGHEITVESQIIPGNEQKTRYVFRDKNKSPLNEQEIHNLHLSVLERNSNVVMTFDLTRRGDVLKIMGIRTAPGTTQESNDSSEDEMDIRQLAIQGIITLAKENGIKKIFSLNQENADQLEQAGFTNPNGDHDLDELGIRTGDTNAMILSISYNTSSNT